MEHEKYVPLLLVVKLIEILFEEVEVQQTVRHKIVFDAFILKVSIDSLYVFQVFECELQQLVWRFVLVVCNDEWPIESVVTKQFQLLCVVIPCQCLFRALHIKYV